MTATATRSQQGVGVPAWLVPAVAVAALVVALLLGGGADAAVLPGLTDPGALTRWGLPLAELVLQASATVAVGFALLAVLLPTDRGDLRPLALQALAHTGSAALVWAAAAAVVHLLTLSDLIGVPLPLALTGSALASFTFTVAQGQATAVVMLLALALAATSRLTLRHGGSVAVLLLALAALSPTALTGHAASGDYHTSASTSLFVHVAGVALWVGGVLALWWLSRRAEPTTLARAAAAFSPLAAGCLVAVAASGTLNAVLRLTAPADLLITPYGRLVALKVAAVGVLVLVGQRHRSRTLPRLRAGQPGAFGRLVAGEAGLMAATMGLAVALTRTAPPVPVEPVAPTLARALLGFPVPPEPTPLLLITRWYPDAFFALVTLAMVVLYALGLRRLRHRGDAWPLGRSVAWFSGTALLAVMTLSGVMTYSMLLLSVHMSQHMVLAMAVPFLLVLAAPFTLALRALRPAPRGSTGPRELLLAALHSRVTKVLTHPVVALLLVVTAAPTVYFSGLFEWAMFHHQGHVLMSLHFLLGGFLFFQVTIGVDPLPRRPAYPVRVVMVLAAAGFHAFFGVGLLQASNLVAPDWYLTLGQEVPWLPDPLVDQQVAAQITWGFGELPALAALMVLLVQWARADSRVARRHDKHGAPDHEAYNAYLAALAARDEASAGGPAVTVGPPGTLDAPSHGVAPTRPGNGQADSGR
jgi:putative copper resistance protein D